MRIEEEIKLDYSDVLFRPKRSTLKSRKEVNLERTYKFKYSNKEWSGIPIIASNMDGVGELEVATSLSEFKILTTHSLFIKTHEEAMELLLSLIKPEKMKNYDVHLADEEWFEYFYYPPQYVQAKHTSDIGGDGNINNKRTTNYGL